MLAVLVGLGQDEVLDELAALAEEHVFGPDQAYTLGAEPAGPSGVQAVVRVGEHAQPAPRVGVDHDPVHRADELAGLAGVRVRAERSLEVTHDRGGHDRHLAEVHLAAGAVDGDDIAVRRRRRTACPCRGRLRPRG